jgi:hypothetical protein
LIQIYLPADVAATRRREGRGFEAINRIVLGSNEDSVSGVWARSHVPVAAVQTLDVERLRVDEAIGGIGHGLELSEVYRRG